MALKWDGPRCELETTHWIVEINDKVLARDDDGRKTGGVCTRWGLWRRLLYTSGLWSKWALVSNFDTEAEAKAYAEDF
jgi:hypothetical protein